MNLYRRAWMVGLTMAMGLTRSASAQAPAAEADVNAKASGPKLAKDTSPSITEPTLPSLDSVRVLSVDRLDRDTTDKRAGIHAGLGDIIKLRVRNLQSLMNYSRCLSDKGVSVKNCREREQTISLYLDGREIKGLTPESGAPRPENGELQFHLQRSADSDEAWADLLGAPTIFNRNDFFVRPTEVSVGLSGMYALDTDVGPMQFQLIRMRVRWFIACSILLLPIIELLRRAAKNSPLLRDPGPTVKGSTVQLRTYSLGRTQMAFWFVLILAAFLYIWLVTGSWDSITPSVLGLMGIGAGTALGAAAIDSNKPRVAAASEGFIKDLLTDDNGYSFHRLQMFAWTLILGVLFVYSVWSRLSMPAFSGTLLTLLGISGGTYLGFKIPEK